MVATVIGNSTDKVRLGDHATATNGSYEMYLNPTSISESWDFEITKDSMSGSSTEYHAPADNNGGSQANQNNVNILLKGCRIENDQTKWDNFKIALVYWARDNKQTYYTEGYGASTTNQARWPANSNLAMVNYYVVRVLHVDVVEKNINNIFFNMVLRRFNTS